MLRGPSAFARTALWAGVSSVVTVHLCSRCKPTKDLWSLLTRNLSKSGASNVIRAYRSLPLLVLRAYLCVLRVGRLIKNDLINVCSLQFSLRCINIGKHGVESCVSLSNQIVSSFYTSVCPFPRECPFREEDYSKGNK